MLQGRGYRGTGARSLVAALGLLVALGLAACGSAGANNGGAYGGSTSTTGGAVSSSGGVNLQCASGAAVCTKTVAVNGKSQTALADSKGMTLYYFTPDSATMVACTGSCAQTWPPLLASGGSVTGTSLSGALATVNGANGAQVEYNGHPLYHFSGDKSQSDTNGEGIGNTWFVATSGLATNGGAPASGSPTNTPGNGYGGGY